MSPWMGNRGFFSLVAGCFGQHIFGRRPKSIAAKQRELIGTGNAHEKSRLTRVLECWNRLLSYYLKHCMFCPGGGGGVGIQQMFIREGSAPRSNPLHKRVSVHYPSKTPPASFICHFSQKNVSLSCPFY